MVAGLRGGLRVLPFVVGYGGFGGLCVVSAGCVVYVSSFVVGVVVFCLLSCWFQAIIYPINWFINVIECPTDPGFE